MPLACCKLESHPLSVLYLYKGRDANEIVPEKQGFVRNFSFKVEILIVVVEPTNLPDPRLQRSPANPSAHSTKGFYGQF